MEATVSSYLLSGFANLVSEHGGNLEAIAQMSGIPLDAFFERDRMVSASCVVAAFELAAQSCSLRSFGIRLAQKSSLAVVEPLWPLLSSAATAREMLSDLATNFRVYSDRALVSVVPTEGGVMLQYDIAAGTCESQVQIVEFSLALTFKELVHQVDDCGDNILFLFRHSRPASLSDHVGTLGPNLIFDHDCNAMFVDQAILEKRCRGADRSRHAQAGMQIGALLDMSRLGAAQKVEVALRALPNLSDCSLDTIAEALGYSTRSLQRALMDEGCSFRQIVNDVRADMALKYVQDSKLDIGRIAELLGYSEISAFSRAFRRWHGSTAVTSRQALRSTARKWTK